MNWAADTVHFVLFAPGPAEFDSLSIWQQLFGQTPTNFQKNPAQRGVGAAFGPLGDYQAIVSTNLGRIELLISAAPSPVPGIPLLDHPIQALYSLVSPAQTLINTHMLSRLSLVTKLAKEFPSAEEAGRAFVALTGVEMPSFAREITLSVNIRSAFSDGTLMNRIAKYQTAQRRVMMLQAGEFAAPPVTTASEFLSLEIDVNSEMSVAPIEPPRARAMLDELLTESEKILSDGYDYVLHRDV